MRLNSSVIRRRLFFDPYFRSVYAILVCGSSVECMGDGDFGLPVGKCVFGWFGASFEANRFLRAVLLVRSYHLVHLWWNRERRRNVRWSPSPFVFRYISLTNVIVRTSQSQLNGSLVPLRTTVRSGKFLSHLVHKSTVGICSNRRSRYWELEGVIHIASSSLFRCFATTSIGSVFYGNDLFCRV